MTAMSDFTYVTAEQNESPLALLMRMIRRRLGLIAFCIVLSTTISVFWALNTTQEYQARALVILDNRQRAAGDTETSAASLPPVTEPALVYSEMALLMSPSMAAANVQKMGLQQHPDLNAPPGVLDEVKTYLDPVKNYIRSLMSNVPASDGDTANGDASADDAGLNNTSGMGTDLLAAAQYHIPENVLRAYQDRLTVTNDGRSYVLQVAFQSTNAKLAAAIANSHAQLYIQNQIDVKFGATRQVSVWLSDQIASVQSRLEDAESKAQQYRAEHGLAAELGMNTAQQQLGDLSKQLTTLEITVSEKESQLSEMRRLRDAPVGAEAASIVLVSPLIQQLREQEATVLRENSSMLSTLGPRHPDAIKIQAQLNNLRSKIRSEADRIADTLQTELRAAQSNLAKVKGKLSDAERQAHGMDAISIGYAGLLREVETNRELLRSLVARHDQVAAHLNFQIPDARLVSAAIVPSVPSWPRPILWMLMAAFTGTVIGVLLAVLLERSGSGFRNSAEVEQTVQLPVLGVTPMARRRLMRQPSPVNDVVTNPRSLYAESLLSIGALLRRLRGKHAVRTLLVTSCLPQEGKTVFSISLARAFARMGERVLLIDCDLRRPMVAKYLCASANIQHGILAVLEGRAEAEDVTLIDEESGLYFIPGEWTGSAQPPGALLTGLEFQVLLGNAERNYDRVIIDSPPLAAASDAMTLAQAASGTIFLVHARTTRRKLVQATLRRMSSSGANILGVVLAAARYDKDAFTADDLEHYFHRYARYYARPSPSSSARGMNGDRSHPAPDRRNADGPRRIGTAAADYVPPRAADIR